MRIDTEEKKALFQAIKDVNGEVYLFGSRADDTQRGGDIDILIFSKENPYKLSENVAVQFFLACEEKIDVIVMDPENLTMEQQAFLNLIKKVKIK